MIEGLTDRRILPRLGKIRTGIKKSSASGSEYPEETPYFVLNPIEEVLDKMGNAIGTRENEHIKALIRMFGDKPHELPIVFPSDDVSIIADANLKWWSGDVKKKKATLICRGNGRFAQYRGQIKVTGMDGDPAMYPEGMNRICSREHCPQSISKVCKANMNLIFLIPQYTLYGVFQLDTTSSQAITSVHSMLEWAKVTLRKDRITSLAGVPMKLFRERKVSQYKTDKGEQGTSVNYPIKILINEEALVTEVAKINTGTSASLFLGLENYVVEPLSQQLLEEEVPDYDSLPQSTHGRLQTGDVPAEAEEPEDDNAIWKDPEILMLFKKLSDKMKIPLTDARMEATAAKFNTKEELEEYLNSKLTGN